MGAEEEAIEDVEAFLIAVALGPGLGVAGPEEFRDGDAGDGAGPGAGASTASPISIEMSDR